MTVPIDAGRILQTMNSTRSKNILLIVGIFVLLLGYFVFGNGWYVPAKLRIKGVALEMSAELEVSWDAGEGWNIYEREIFHINTLESAGAEENHAIIIRNMGKKHAGSMSDTVICSRIRIDGKDVSLQKIESTGKYNAGGIHLTTPEEAIRLTLSAKEHIYIELMTNNHSGKVMVSVNGRKTIHDLYMANEEAKKIHLDYWVVQSDGQFAVSMNMPRYGIKTLRLRNRVPSHPIYLTSAAVQSEKGTFPLQPIQGKPFTNQLFSDVNSGLRRYLAPSRFVLQMIFAAVTTWLFIAIYAMVERCGGIIPLLISKQRYLFWLFFAGAVSIYSLWLTAFWPGIMSVDSLKVWRAARLPEVLINDHPLLYVYFYTYLQHIWDHVAVVPIFHIVFISQFLSYILFSLLR